MMKKIKFSFLFIKSLFFLPVFLFFAAQLGWAIPDEEIHRKQGELQGKRVGERIAFWAERFVGTPYDEDPKGDYVSRAVIVADEKVDCMYLSFRAVELALSHNPEEAVQIALQKRFHSRGMLKDGKVINYDDRFEYGEDMIHSGKWGKEITFQMGRTIRIKGSRGRDFWEILPSAELIRGMAKLKSGDLIFFMKFPEKRMVDEGVGHMGIVKIEELAGRREIYLIHASGLKNKGGAVKKVLLKDYIDKMPFVGVKITRFD
ncbi:MAG: hypothetical protein KKH04_14925 [Proteobacteria bacterium]|nr:hypothetical protein [Pseudomonadota bacterium]